MGRSLWPANIGGPGKWADQATMGRPAPPHRHRASLASRAFSKNALPWSASKAAQSDRPLPQRHQWTLRAARSQAPQPQDPAHSGCSQQSQHASQFWHPPQGGRRFIPSKSSPPRHISQKMQPSHGSPCARRAGSTPSPSLRLSSLEPAPQHRRLWPPPPPPRAVHPAARFINAAASGARRAKEKTAGVAGSRDREHQVCPAASRRE